MKEKKKKQRWAVYMALETEILSKINSNFQENAV